MTCLFYNLLIALLSVIITKSLNIKNLINYLFPPLGNRHWYITSYSIVFFCIPLLNDFFNKISRKAFNAYLIFFFTLFSCLSIFSLHDIFYINWGYSFSWLIYCYTVGIYIKRFNIKIRSVYSLLIILINTIAIFCSRLILVKLSRRFLGCENYPIINLFMRYNSPFVLINAICFVLIFIRVEVQNRIFKRIIKILSITSFDVYIIHAHPFILDNYIYNGFDFIFREKILMTIIFAILSIVIVYLICSLIGLLRAYLFKILRINNVIKKFGTIVNSFFDSNK